MFKHRGSSLWVVLTAGTLMSLGVAASAQAETQWEKNHPRRDQVNDRLEHQNARIRQEVREGEMSPRRAAMLHHEDHQIRREERLMASQNGGHITRQEQRVLNAQENKVSRRIGR